MSALLPRPNQDPFLALLQQVCAQVKYKNWSIESYIGGFEPHAYLQVSFLSNGDIQRGRKWKLSKHMTKSEIVQTALKAVLAAEEHEAREKFLYRGRAIFGPHFDVDALVTLCDAGTLDMRKPA